jgi:hypothetical protein
MSIVTTEVTIASFGLLARARAAAAILRELLLEFARSMAFSQQLTLQLGHSETHVIVLIVIAIIKVLRRGMRQNKPIRGTSGDRSMRRCMRMSVAARGAALRRAHA